MTTEQKVTILAVITTTNEAGHHFTEVYAADDLAELEEECLIVVTRPVHEATGIAYSQEHWSVRVTDDGRELVEAHPEYCMADFSSDAKWDQPRDWRGLQVSGIYGPDDEPGCDIQVFLKENPDTIEDIILNDGGAVDQWMNYYIAYPEEAPDWDTPAGPVNWDGFREFLASLSTPDDE